MSRIGKMPINIPAGVDVDIKNNVVTVKGPKGTLIKELHKDMIIKKEGAQILISRPSDEKSHKSLHGLTRTLVNNMVNGVTKGFEKALDVNGVGYRAQKQGNKLVLTLGYSHPVEMDEPAGITVDVPAPTR
jgi:large subunit ribosomal protein L6